MATIRFWGGKLDGIVINTEDSDKQDWHLFLLMLEMSLMENPVGALYYYGEHYIIKPLGNDHVALCQEFGGLYDILQDIKDVDFPEDQAYFF